MLIMAHYFSKKPDTKENRKDIPYIFKSYSFRFLTSSSVFSRQKIDRGTEVLIEYASIKEDSEILDLGCGYGVVGIVLSRIYKNIKVTMSDINERAILLSSKNLELNNLKADVIESDLFKEIKGKFDTILSNPPFSAGKDLCIKIIDESVNHLKKGGSLQIVARHNKGGKVLSKRMEEVFGNVMTLGKASGFHVYISVKN